MAAPMACPPCGSTRLIPLTYSAPAGHRVESDPIAAAHSRRMHKCVDCGHVQVAGASGLRKRRPLLRLRSR